VVLLQVCAAAFGPFSEAGARRVVHKAYDLATLKFVAVKVST
jgi:hypothetical protein